MCTLSMSLGRKPTCTWLSTGLGLLLVSQLLVLEGAHAQTTLAPSRTDSCFCREIVGEPFYRVCHVDKDCVSFDIDRSVDATWVFKTPSDSILHVVTIIDGREEGTWLMSRSGCMTVAFFKHGKAQGPSVTFHRDGRTVWIRRNYHNGKLRGYIHTYNEVGELIDRSRPNKRP